MIYSRRAIQVHTFQAASLYVGTGIVLFAGDGWLRAALGALYIIVGGVVGVVGVTLRARRAAQS